MISSRQQSYVCRCYIEQYNGEDDNSREMKTCTAFYGTQKFLNAFTRNRHWSLVRIRKNQCNAATISLYKPTFHISLQMDMSFLIFRYRIWYAFVSISHACYMISQSHPSWLDSRNQWFHDQRKLWRILSCDTYRRVIRWKSTDVSEVYTASTFRAKEWTANTARALFDACFQDGTFSGYFSILMMKEIFSSKTSIEFQRTTITFCPGSSTKCGVLLLP
jgi:hypothetical protein